MNLWYGRVMRQVKVLPDDQQVLISGPTEDFVASKCLDLLTVCFLAKQTPPITRPLQPLSKPWKCREVDVVAFMQPYRDFRV